MNKQMIRLAIAFAILTGCDKPTPITGREEAGQVAIQCVSAMGACEDWTPIQLEDKRTPSPLENCDGAIARGDFDCKSRNNERRQQNWEISETPAWRSPCQQKIDSCVRLVDALIGAPATVHNHYER